MGNPVRLQVMAAKFVAAACALSAPASAFVAPGRLHLQEQASATAASGSVEVVPQRSHPAVSSTGWVAAGALGVGFAGLVFTTASASRKQRCAVERQAIGICFPLTEKFDPLNLGSTDAKMERYTAVEIKHGRVAMIATVGYVMPEVFRFPGCEGFQNGLGALSTIPVEGWVQLIAFIGAHEVGFA